MAIIKGEGHLSALYPALKKHMEDFYDGKLPYPCDEYCPEGCDGKHNYPAMPVKYPLIFTE